MYCQSEPTLFCPPLSTGDARGSQVLDFSAASLGTVIYLFTSIGMSFGDPLTTPFKSNLGSMYLGPSGRVIEKKFYTFFFFALRCACFCLISLSKLCKCSYGFLQRRSQRRSASFILLSIHQLVHAVSVDLILCKLCIDHLSLSEFDCKF